MKVEYNAETINSKKINDYHMNILNYRAILLISLLESGTIIDSQVCCRLFFPFNI